MNEYVGNWVSLTDLNRPLEVGDLVMMETLDDTKVVSISNIQDDHYWHFNGWIIPDNQIVAVKQKEGE